MKYHDLFSFSLFFCVPAVIQKPADEKKRSKKTVVAVDCEEKKAINNRHY
jgi:hypothetical protein